MEIFISDDSNHQAITKTIQFSGGELHVKIEDVDKLDESGHCKIVARIQSPDDLIRLMLTKEILERKRTWLIHDLVIPYFPYARQDRVTDDVASFSLQPIAHFINSLEFDSVTIYDPHSNVTPSLLKYVEIVSQLDIINRYADLHTFNVMRSPIIVAPDAGAVKKCTEVAEFLGRPLGIALKKRDPKTGKLEFGELVMPYSETTKTALIVDDICDGGRTFIELAKMLRSRGIKRVALYVTHGIFSQGLDCFNGLIDDIFTTSTFVPQGLVVPSSVNFGQYLINF